MTEPSSSDFVDAFEFDESEFEELDLDAGSAEESDESPMFVPAPVVAVVGRPNVGKSTLVNRVLGRRQAVVEDVPAHLEENVREAARSCPEQAIEIS